MKCVALGLLLGIILAILGGCAHTHDYKVISTQLPEYGVNSIDVGDNVKCFALTDKDDIRWSCVQVKSCPKVK